MGEVTFSERLSSRQRWQLAWALIWPSLLFDILTGLLTFDVIRHYVGEQRVEAIKGICQALFFFVALPWIVRRIVRLDFQGFHLVAVRRPAGGETRTISYGEGLSVGWLLAWRVAAAASVLECAIYLGLWALRGARPPRFPSLGSDSIAELVIGNLFTFLLFYVWLVPAAIRKTYSGFVLQVRETTSLTV